MASIAPFFGPTKLKTPKKCPIAQSVVPLTPAGESIRTFYGLRLPAVRLATRRVTRDKTKRAISARRSFASTALET